MSGRKRRRSDGKLRPSVRRYRLRKRARETGRGYVDPAAEERFHALVLPGTHIWAGSTLQQQAGLDQEELGLVLEQIAGAARWAKLRDSAGVVRAIGMPPNHPQRRDRSRSEHRAAMRALVVEAARLQREAVA